EPRHDSGSATHSKPASRETLRGRGVRYLTLTHIHHLPWAASSGDPWSAPHGLQPFGREVVAEVERLRILVGVSHVHEPTFWDVQRIATKPFIATHSCAAALCPIARNLSDDQIRAIADSGGWMRLN